MMRTRALPLTVSFASLVLLSVAAGLAAAPTTKPAAPAVSPATELFEKEIRPLLLAECGACHGPTRQEGGLRLDDRAGAVKGGSRGASLSPGHPEKSLLLQAIRHEGLKMPPGKRLPEAKIALLES